MIEQLCEYCKTTELCTLTEWILYVNYISIKLLLYKYVYIYVYVCVYVCVFMTD